MRDQGRWDRLSIPLRIVFYRENGVLIAHCLEFDLLGDGKDKREALDRLAEAIRLQLEASIELDDPGNLFNPADGAVFQRYAEGKHIAAGFLEISAAKMREQYPQITKWEAREYDADYADRGDLVTTCGS